MRPFSKKAFSKEHISLGCGFHWLPVNQKRDLYAALCLNAARSPWEINWLAPLASRYLGLAKVG